MLDLVDVRAGYGDAEVLHGISISIRAGSLVALVGGNSAGKSTIAGVIAGTVPVRSGHVKFNGVVINAVPAYQRVRSGIVLVPEGRKLFPQLSVEETLTASSAFDPVRAQRRRNVDRMYALFPRLHERRRQLAETMSGGEQQMLAIARGLMSEPRFLILDEPSLGLAPKMVEQIFEATTALRKQDLTILLIEQHLKEALKRCDYAYVVENGTIALEGSGAELLADVRTREAYLGKLDRQRVLDAPASNSALP
ncbi:MAG: ABC transporter ATP-binding protein [Betaproteobacteria bacterium]|nr:ABC transporter ATP-binding protein [Betaproteobacteria bacterium]